MKKKMCLIIRGFLYKENHKPISWRKKYFQDGFTLDFRKNLPYYKSLIDMLSKKYDLHTVITTYDSTPKDILEEARNSLNAEIFLSSELKSKQFTTSVTAIEQLNKNNFDFLLLIRSDLILREKLFNIIVHSDLSSNHVHVLSRELKHNFLSLIDVLHIIPKTIIDKFLLHIRTLPRWLHDIHEFMPTKELIDDKADLSLPRCYCAYRCHDYYTIVPDIEVFH